MATAFPIRTPLSLMVKPRAIPRSPHLASETQTRNKAPNILLALWVSFCLASLRRLHECSHIVGLERISSCFGLPAITIRTFHSFFASHYSTSSTPHSAESSSLVTSASHAWMILVAQFSHPYFCITSLEQQRTTKLSIRTVHACSLFRMVFFASATKIFVQYNMI
jgi:hypothetical protein